MAHSPSLRELLRAYRKSMGWTQEQAAIHLNYSPETISAWERGKRKPSNQEIPKLAKLLSVTPEKLARTLREGDGQQGQSNGTARLSGRNQDEWKEAYETWGELVHIYRNRTEFNRAFSYARMFENAQHVLAVGISLNAIALTYSQDTLTHSILDSGCSFELCFLDPEGAQCREREREENLIESTIANLTRTNILHMRNLQRRLAERNAKAASHLRLSTYNLPPRYNIYLVDDTMMTVQTYGYGRGEDTPTLILRRQQARGLFDFYSTAVQYILEHASPIGDATLASVHQSTHDEGDRE